MNDKCTLLLSTCDSYEDTWYPFFKCLKHYWKGFNMPIVINTESKEFNYDGLDIKTFGLFKDKKVPWGKRLLEHLKRIDTEYIFFMLDDFFIADNVDVKFIEKCYNWMEKDKNIGCFCLHRVDDDTNIPSDKYPKFDLRSKNGMYRMNCQAALWRRDTLIKCLKENEDPWDWEIYGSIRSRNMKEEFYSIHDGEKEPIDYNMETGWSGICRGKWVKSAVEPLFKRLDIKVDYKIRGFFDEKPILKKRTLKDKVICKTKKAQAYIESMFIK